MTFDDSFWRALADYQLQFPTLASLGENNPPALWYAEYQRVRATAFAAVQITSGSFEGGASSGVQSFSQETLLDALHCRRFDLDNTYELPAHLANYVAIRTARRSSGMPGVITFRPGLN